MKVTILEKKANELKVEIEGEGHTFCNVLQKALLEDDTIEMAAYDIPHPLISNPIVYVRTDGHRRPETALREAVKKIRRLNRDFGKIFENALKEWERRQ